MRPSPVFAVATAFVSAAGLALIGAWGMAHVVEQRTATAVAQVLQRDGLTWASATTDGLQVHLAGTAPSEAQRFRALNLTGSVVDAGRIRDRLEVTPTQALEAPRFSVELLRNDDGIALIGLVPVGDGSKTLLSQVQAIAGDTPVADMLTEADFAPSPGWDQAVGYGLSALALLPRSKISIAADGVAVTAIAGSVAEKRRLETDLARSRPAGIAASIEISAPRPVLTPFTLRFVKDETGARFDACAADTDPARDRIIAAAVAAGFEGKADCVIGLGVPTPRWAEATAAGIAAIGALDGGTITFSDADVTLLAAAGTSQAVFDRVVGDLEAALPDVFSLNATLPEKPRTDLPEGPAEFTATLSPEGKVVMRGRLADEAQRDAMTSFARARFGADDVLVATRLDPDLPDGWPVRVLAALAAMSELQNGQVVVRPESVAVSGVSGSSDAQAAISRVLSGQLGPGQAFEVRVSYDKRLDPQAALPTPQECIADLNAVLATGKITFAPGSAEIEANAAGTMGALADILRRCPDIPMEIAGHTDSQGSDSGNRALSQARAEAVLLGLQGRRVMVGPLTAKGYGEDNPIADNATAAGREANRRIEFSLTGAAAEKAAAGRAEPPAATLPDGTPPGTPLAQVPVVVPVNADPDAAGAKRPRSRPETGTEAEAETAVEPAPAPVLPGFGRPQSGALDPASGAAEEGSNRADLPAPPAGDAAEPPVASAPSLPARASQPPRTRLAAAPSPPATGRATATLPRQVADAPLPPRAPNVIASSDLFAGTMVASSRSGGAPVADAAPVARDTGEPASPAPERPVTP